METHVTAHEASRDNSFFGIVTALVFSAQIKCRHSICSEQL